MREGAASGRYAKALLSLAQEKNVLDDVNKDMLLFAETCEQSNEFLLLLRNPIVNHTKKLDILKAIFGGKVSELSLEMFNLITRKNREPILYEISRSFHKQYNVVKGIQTATVVTTVALNDNQRDQLTGTVRNLTGLSIVELKEEIDPTIVGG